MRFFFLFLFFRSLFAAAQTAENNKIEVTRNGIIYEVGASGCSACNVTRSGTTFTFATAISSGEVIKVKCPKQ